MMSTCIDLSMMRRHPLSYDPDNFVLLHGDGFINQTPYPAEIYRGGSIFAMNDDFKFPPSSYRFYTGALTMILPSVWDGSWTLDFWVTTENPSVNQTIAAVGLSLRDQVVLSQVYDQMFLDVNGRHLELRGLWFKPGWHHIAIVRNVTAGNVTVYTDGNYNVDARLPAGALALRQALIGNSIEESFTRFEGLVDEIRLSKVARWLGDFLPPTKPYI